MLSLRDKSRWNCRQSESMDPAKGFANAHPGLSLLVASRRLLRLPRLPAPVPKRQTPNAKRLTLPRQTLQGFPILFARFFYDFRRQLRGGWFLVPGERLEIVTNKLFVETGRA
jgi:hypothetical protein